MNPRDDPTDPDRIETEDTVPASSRVVCLGASAGGLEALQEFFDALTPDTGAAYVVILHLSPDFKSLMPELLSRHTAMPVVPAKHATRIQPNSISIIPPGKNMVYRGGELLLHDQDRAPGHPLNLPIDIFLRSLAEELSGPTIGLILSGTGSDGSRGIRSLKDAGGIVLAQDPSSARFDGMPRSALETGIVDATGSPAELAQRVAHVFEHGASFPDVDVEEEDSQDGDLSAVLEVLRSKFSNDFGYLRQSMLMRRVRRRMALMGVDDLQSYAEALRKSDGEAKQLRNDLFIGVTGFFRDELAFEQLKAHLIKDQLVESSGEPLRMWVPACATGEEAYSLLILALEAMEQTGTPRSIKLFATDIDEDALARASRATYTAGELADLSKSRLARYFVHNGETMSVQPALREMVICAKHNLVADPPFTRLDLISCRNFLIYLDQASQEQVLASLHFALKPKGTLFLGSAEALGRLEGEFDTVDAKCRIFSKSRNVVLPSMRRRAGLNDPLTVLSRAAPSRRKEQDAGLQQVLEALTEGEGTTAALLSPEGQLLEVIADPLQAFQLPKGRPTSDAVRLVKRSVSAALSTALQRLRRGESEARCALTLDDLRRSASVRLRRLPPVGSHRDRVLMLLLPGPELSEVDEVTPMEPEADASLQVTELQIELQQTRESLQATIEELQSSNEEQQSTNEELIASNEELQSTNEELQSVNEELFTVNVEHQGKIQELAVLAADLDNLLRAIDVGTLFLDENLRIRKFTPSIDRVVRLVEHDVGRSFVDFAHGLGPGFDDDVRRVLDTGTPNELEVRGPKGTWLLVRVLPYMTHSEKPSGVVITVIDVTATRNAREMTRLSNEQLADANRRLSHQREELEDLFSIVAHDLKRPVLALDGLLTLSAEAGGTSDELLAKARGECARMRRMLEDLGHVSGLSRRPSPVEDVELRPWCDDLLERVRSEAGERGVQINCVADDVTVSIPRAAVEESAVNLLENALLYGTTASNPRIDLTCLIRDGILELTVRDNGPGIAEENHQKVFEPFRRLVPDAAEGSGLGLMAARRCITQHGGAIGLESEPGKGARFTIRLPVETEGQVDDESKIRPKVLLVEDDTLDSRLIQRFLGDAVSCTHVKMISEAEAQLQRDLFDLVLLDLSLPDGHGLELVRRMRDLMGTPIPIVVVTGHGEGLAPGALSESIAGYVPKSEMRKEELAEVVHRALEPARSSNRRVTT